MTLSTMTSFHFSEGEKCPLTALRRDAIHLTQEYFLQMSLPENSHLSVLHLVNLLHQLIVQIYDY